MEVGRLLGAGAFGQVHLGLHQKTGELFAVKQIVFEGDAHSERDIETYANELQVLMKLDKHPNVVHFRGYVINQEEHHLFLFLEYLPGDLKKQIKQFGPFKPQLHAKYTRQLLAGLSYLHDRRIVHRDIKTSNVLVTSHGVLKLADFGTSKLVSTRVSLLTRGSASLRGGSTIGNMGVCNTMVGTVGYMAPEVVMQENAYGRKADMWSFGMVLFEMAEGDEAFARRFDNFMAYFSSCLTDKCIPHIPEHMDPPLQDVLKKLFVRNPTERASAEEIRRHPYVERAPKSL